MMSPVDRATIVSESCFVDIFHSIFYRFDVVSGFSLTGDGG
jgi:hypothetical protein